MLDPEKRIHVPWKNERWDQAILESDNIARLGGDENFVLYRPGQLLVDRKVAADPRVARLLERYGARRIGGTAAGVAARLRLVLYNVADNRIEPLIRRIRERAPRGAALNQVLIAGPGRFGGDSEPEPTDGTGLFADAQPKVGDDVQISVLDTGIIEHPDLAVKVTGANAEVADADGDLHRDPPAGHGTHVAGIIARRANGATIVADRVLRGVAGQADDLQIAAALSAAAGRGAQLINCSFSGPSLDDVAPLQLERALAALPRETIVVACAGNLGNDRPQWPAASPRVLAVGAVGLDDAGDWRVTDFSNFGSWLDFWAPGVDIPSTFLTFTETYTPVPDEDKPKTFEGYATWTGTSMSCPQVTAAIATIAARDGISHADAVGVLRAAGQPIAPAGVLVDPDNLP